MDEQNRSRLLLAALQVHLSTSPDMIFVKDPNLVYQAGSDCFARLVGHEKGEELVGKTDFDIFSPELAKRYTNDDHSILDSGVDMVDYLEPLPERDGRKLYSSTSKYLLRDEDGALLGFLGVARDVSAEAALEAERESGQLSRQMFDSVLEADLNENRLLRVEGSGWVEQLAQDMNGGSFTDAIAYMNTHFIHPDYICEFLQYYDPGLLKANYALNRDEFKHITYLRSGGAYRWVECHTRVYHSRVSNTLRITTFIKDMDEEVRQKQTLQEKAVTDALTGLRNRESIFSGIVERMKQQPDRLHALFFIDLDCFKQVNDCWGHHLGDEVLRGTSERLQDFFRARDALLGRIGGDEFLIFLPDLKNDAEVHSVARALMEQLPFCCREADREVCVTYSVGVSIQRGGEVTMEQFCQQADSAMYHAKTHGRNQLYFYEGPC